MWSRLGASTASLKFRQFESAVCDAFWGFFLRSSQGRSLLFRGLQDMWFALWGAGA